MASTATPSKPIDWADPKWSLPNVHISGTGSFLDAERA